MITSNPPSSHICSTKCHPVVCIYSLHVGGGYLIFKHPSPPHLQHKMSPPCMHIPPACGGGRVFGFLNTRHLHIYSTICHQWYSPRVSSGYLIVLVPVTSTSAAPNVTGSMYIPPLCWAGVLFFDTRHSPLINRFGIEEWLRVRVFENQIKFRIVPDSPGLVGIWFFFVNCSSIYIPGIWFLITIIVNNFDTRCGVRFGAIF